MSNIAVLMREYHQRMWLNAMREAVREGRQYTFINTHAFRNGIWS